MPVRSLLASVAYLELELHKMNMETAFLHGDLDEDVYMEVAEYVNDKDTNLTICNLTKALYQLN